MAKTAWQNIWQKNFTCPHAFADFLELDTKHRRFVLKHASFALNVPYRLATKMAKNSLVDPLVRQFLGHIDELESSPNFPQDPVQDLSFCRSPLLLQKYQGRALLLASSACAMHCRFCFRRHFPHTKGPTDFSKELQLIKTDPSLREIILSGGDPLSLPNATLRHLLTSLSSIPHIQRIRFHTRFPIGIPERIDAEFLKILATAKSLFFVIHINHPKELDNDVVSALRKIRLLGIPILSQSVLLKGVNDHEETLLDLCEQLINAGILPYYLHLLDRVAGSSHFEVSEERGRKLIAHVQKKLSGYGVPRLVREEPGEENKTWISLHPLDSLKT